MVCALEKAPEFVLEKVEGGEMEEACEPCDVREGRGDTVGWSEGGEQGVGVNVENRRGVAVWVGVTEGNPVGVEKGGVILPLPLPPVLLTLANLEDTGEEVRVATVEGLEETVGVRVGRVVADGDTEVERVKGAVSDGIRTLCVGAGV